MNAKLCTCKDILFDFRFMMEAVYFKMVTAVWYSFHMYKQNSWS